MARLSANVALCLLCLQVSRNNLITFASEFVSKSFCSLVVKKKITILTTKYYCKSAPKSLSDTHDPKLYSCYKIEGAVRNTNILMKACKNPLNN